MTIDNPNYALLVEKYGHLKSVKVNDNDDRPQFPIHVVLGASKYATIKTTTAQRVGKPGQPVAEQMPLGWTIMLWSQVPKAGTKLSYPGRRTIHCYLQTTLEARETTRALYP